MNAIFHSVVLGTVLGIIFTMAKVHSLMDLAPYGL